jgi:hypothetical protein
MNALTVAQELLVNTLGTIIVIGGILGTLLAIARACYRVFHRITPKPSGATKNAAPMYNMDATKWDAYETPAFLRKASIKA